MTTSPKRLSTEEVSRALYVTSPCGQSELRGHLNWKYGDFDEGSLERALTELIGQGKVVKFAVGEVVMWCLRGQRVG